MLSVLNICVVILALAYLGIATDLCVYKFRMVIKQGMVLNSGDIRD